jgi:hypothetical protein
MDLTEEEMLLEEDQIPALAGLAFKKAYLPDPP